MLVSFKFRYALHILFFKNAIKEYNFDDILITESGMYCIEPAVQYVKQLLLFSRVHHESRRNNDVMMVWLPRLLDTVLSLLTDKNHTKDDLSLYIRVKIQHKISTLKMNEFN